MLTMTAPRTGLMTDLIPKVTAAMSAYDWSAGLEAKYVFTSTFKEEVRGAIREGNTLWVPRESAPYADPNHDFRRQYPGAAIDCTFIPRHEQQSLCEKSIALLKSGRNHIFEAPTAHGKTVEGSYIACRLGQPTIIVVTKQDLLDQWRKALTDVLGVPASLIGHVQQDVCDWQGKRFVLAMVQSLIIPDKYPPEMFRYFGFLILDEVHQMAAECFVRVCQKFTAAYRLGFSATPYRSDGKTKLLHWHIGPTLVRGTILSMKAKVLVRQTGWRIPTRRKQIGNSWEQVQIPHAPGRMMLVTKAMASSDTRNMEIVNFTLQSYKAGRTTLIMSDLKEDHLNRLFQMLCGEGIPGNEIGYYVGGMAKHALQLSKTRKIVLGTYQMCSTGTDVPKWDTLVMATPRANIKQSVGRVLRYAEQKKQPVILDLVDYNPIFQSFHGSRRKQYKELGAEVVKV